MTNKEIAESTCREYKTKMEAAKTATTYNPFTLDAITWRDSRLHPRRHVRYVEKDLALSVFIP